MNSRNDGPRPESDWSDDEEEKGFQLPAFLSDPVGVFCRRWPWLMLALLMGFSVTGFFVKTWVPEYVAKSTVLMGRQQIPEEFVRSTVRDDQIASLDAMVGKLMAIDTLSELIEEFDLYPEQREQVSRIDLIAQMRGQIEFAPEGYSGGNSNALLYSLSFSSENPAIAANVANALAGRFIDASIARRSEQARRTTEFLRRALARDEQELKDQARIVGEFRKENRGELPDELETSLHKLELLAQRRASLVNQLSAVEARLSALSGETGPRLQSENELLLEELRRQLARESAVYTDEHPNVSAVRRRITRLEELVADQGSEIADLPIEMKNTVADLEWQIGRIERDLTETEGTIEAVNGHVDRMPQVAEKLASLEEKQQVLRERYLQSLRKVEEAELAESLELAQQGAQVSILDRAENPTEPERERWLLALAGLLGSFGFALSVVVMLELFDPIVVSSRQLEDIAELPVLGSLPKIAERV